MKAPLQIATLVLTAGVAFLLGWNLGSGDSEPGEAADQAPIGNTRSTRARRADGGDVGTPHHLAVRRPLRHHYSDLERDAAQALAAIQRQIRLGQATEAVGVLG